MTLPDDRLLLIAAALAAALLTALVVSIWVAISHRRALTTTRENLRLREEELAEARAVDPCPSSRANLVHYWMSLAFRTPP